MLKTDIIYVLTRKADMKARTRVDEYTSTRNYLRFEQQRATAKRRATEKRDAVEIGALVGYVEGTRFMNQRREIALKALRLGDTHVSKLYYSKSVTTRHSNAVYRVSFGDVSGTNDGLITITNTTDTDDNKGSLPTTAFYILCVVPNNRLISYRDIEVTDIASIIERANDLCKNSPQRRKLEEQLRNYPTLF